MRFVLFSFLVLFSLQVFAQGSDQVRYQHYTRSEIPASEKVLNFGAVYVVQWGVYIATQHYIIEEHGSFKNMWENATRPHFDKDHFSYNIGKHTIAGQYYYLFYRSRGYTQSQAFAWAFASSLAFELAIETLTEKASFQDVYQTPVFGTVAGMAFENLSLYLRSIGTTPTTILSYIFNPFTLIPSSTYKFAAVPQLTPEMKGVSISMEF